jgi:cobalt-zinc-cadmium efflux system protein
MRNGHLNACLFLKTGVVGDCRCKDEAKHYLELSLISLGLFLVEFLGGVIAGSLALISDSFHVLVDGTESLISMIVSVRARTDRDENVLRHRGGYISAVLLIGVALWIILVEAPERMANPHLIQVELMLWLAIPGLLVNLVMFRKHINVHEEHKNETHFWQWLHITADIGASVVVILGGIAIWKTGAVIIDPLLSFFLGGVILFIALRRLLLKPNDVNAHSGHNHHSHHHHH